MLRYQDVLKSKTDRDVEQTYQSVKGLFQAEKRTIEQICETVTSRIMQDDGEHYVLDVQEDESVDREEPHPSIPAQTAKRGRIPTRYRVDGTGTTAKAVAHRLTDDDFKACGFRQGTKGGKWR